MDIQAVLAAHAQWLSDPSTGARANLTGANLTEADLTGADLMGANLTGANLTGADLTGADLTRANLTEAVLQWANLMRANLTGANLTGANLTGANLTGADLTGATGVMRLTTTDAGYEVIATTHPVIRILAGCRDFSVEEAKAHWGSPDYHTPSSGRRVVAAIEWMEKELSR